MNRLACCYRSVAICILAFFAAWTSTTVQAQHPDYWIMGRQKPAANVHYVHPQGYAYGWFGAQARPQAVRQTGYYGLYRQWTFR